MCIRNLCAQCVCNSHYLSQLAAFFIDPRANPGHLRASQTCYCSTSCG
ncbi:50S ribosomal protein [Dirofilaria immitis]